MSETELVPWLRALLEYDLEGWRSREAAYLPRAEREDKYLHARAREQAARCEAELAVLELHDTEHLDEDAEDGDYRVRQVCTRCDDGFWPCRTVRLIGYGYRFRDGYKETEWKP